MKLVDAKTDFFSVWNRYQMTLLSQESNNFRFTLSNLRIKK